MLALNCRSVSGIGSLFEFSETEQSLSLCHTFTQFRNLATLSTSSKQTRGSCRGHSPLVHPRVMQASVHLEGAALRLGGHVGARRVGDDFMDFQHVRLGVGVFGQRAGFGMALDE